MYKLIQNIEHDPRINDFQQKLKRDIETMKSSNKLLVHADKSTNLHCKKWVRLFPLRSIILRKNNLRMRLYCLDTI